MEDEDAGGEYGWMGTKKGAAYIGVTQRTLYRLIDDGQVPAYKIGRVIRVRRDDLDDFLEVSRIEPGTLEHLRNPPPSE